MSLATDHPPRTPGAALPPESRIAGLLCFMLAVVATPRATVWPYALHALVLLAVVLVARVPRAALARGVAIETPFVLFALFLPFVATGPAVEVAGMRLSVGGLKAAWALLAKGTLGVLAATALATSTRPDELLRGLRRLRLPAPLVEIAGFMVRYTAVLTEQWRWMGIARASRGFAATSPASWRTLAQSLGVLFLRAYERGERVHLAMLARGYDAALPLAPAPAAAAGAWVRALAPAAASGLITAAAWGLTR